MKAKWARILLLPVLMLSLLTLGTWTQIACAQSFSPQGFLNPDGTLNLDGHFNGVLDTSGYSVRMDPQRGPIFDPGKGKNLSESIASPGNWAGIGDGGGNIDASVRGIAVSGTDVYVVGSFTDAANIPEADYVAKWDGAHWSALGSNGAGNGALSGQAYAVVVNGSDLYVGGEFTDVNDGGTPLAAADRVAKWNGSHWSALGSNGAGEGSLNSTVWALAMSGTNLYAGGSFTNVNNNGTALPEADYVAKWDGTNWSALGHNGAGNGSLSGMVFSLAVSGSSVYAGGTFTDVNNGGTILGAADRVAQWDGSNWSALGSDGAGNGSISAGTVYALAVSGTSVYVGGQFGDVNNNGTLLTASDNLAKWDGTNWSALAGSGIGPNPMVDYVWVILPNGTDVYVGGRFTNVKHGGVTLAAADYVARWDGTNWSALGNDGAGNGAIPNKGVPIVMTIAMQGSNLLVGGTFYDLNNGGTVLPQADYVAQWDGTNWSSLGTDQNGALVNGDMRSEVNAIAILGTNVFVGGSFTNISNHGVNIPEADYIAQWDGSDWSALGHNGGGNGSLNNSVYALAVSGTDLYVGGMFTNVNNKGTALAAADYVAKWDGTNWSALGSNGAGDGAIPAGFGTSVYALAVSGTDVYAAGNFTNVNDNGTVLNAADYIAKWDGTNWSALGSNGAGDGALNSYVMALAASGSNFYVGGHFTNVANIASADYLAKWDGSNWSALGDNGAGNGALNGDVYAIAVSGSSVYVGGTFTDVNNSGTALAAADKIARWDGTGWTALGSNGAGDGALYSALGSAVYAILLDGTDVYVGGELFDVDDNGVPLGAADFITKWDGTHWSSLGSNGAGDGSLDDRVRALALDGSDLLVGGDFANVNNNGTVLKTADYMAAFNILEDATPPAVASITRAGTNPTTAATAEFTVTFSEAVTGVDAADFSPTTTGSLAGAAVSTVSGSGTTFTVSVSTGTGSGTLRLDLADDDSIRDAALNPLGGTGTGNGNFTTGQAYDVRPVSPEPSPSPTPPTLYLPLTMR